MASNIWWQWQHCGMPLARCVPAQVEPCELMDDIEAEWRDLQKRAEVNHLNTDRMSNETNN